MATPYVCIAQTQQGPVRFRVRAVGPVQARRIAERYAYLALGVANPYRNVMVVVARHSDGS